MNPVKPMEPVRVDDIPQGPGWISQIKWDGVRILTYAEPTGVRLFNRHLGERTFHYPELAEVRSYCNAKSAILDGEVIALGDNGQPDFHEVMKRDGLRRLDRVKSVQQSVPIYYMIFDILYADGEWLTDWPLEERLVRLSQIIHPTDHIQRVDAHPDGEALFHVMKARDMEGIVAKRLDSLYRPGQKTDTWRKVKFYRDLIAVVGGYTLGEDGVANALLLGLYDTSGSLCYIGRAGTGRLGGTEWKVLTRRLHALNIHDRPFRDEPDGRANACYVRPHLTVKVQYASWTSGHSLRQPSIQSLVDVDPRTCLIDRITR